jgi:hypothetical protein
VRPIIDKVDHEKATKKLNEILRKTEQQDMVKSLPSFNKNGRKTSFIEHIKSRDLESRSSTVSTAPETDITVKKRGNSEKIKALPPVDEGPKTKKAQKFLEMAEKGMQKRKELAEKARLKQIEKRGEVPQSLSPV